MAEAYSGIAIVISLVALFLAMVAARKAWETKGDCAAKKAESGEKKRHHTKWANEADMRAAVMQRREHLNFMNYDGTVQPPVDPERTNDQ